MVDALDHDYQSNVFRGVVHGAKKHNADLMALVGGQMVFVNRHLEKRQFVYDLAKAREFDGVVLLGTSLSSHEGHAAIAPLIIRFAKLPMVSIGLDIGKGCTIMVDNADGMTKLAEHLIDAHQYTRFAYISGPNNNTEAKTRLKTFEAVLTRHHLHMPPKNLVYGAFTEASGESAVKALLDDRKLDIADLDAIVAANDSMAVGAMDELRRRNIRIPSDVAVVGFDDIEAARYADTPLTTIQQPLIMQGEQAVERVITSDCESTHKTIEVSPKLVIRRSCGCGSYLETPTFSTSPPTAAETLERIVTRKRAAIENDLGMVAERGGISRGWETELLDAIIEACAGKGYRRVTRIVGDLVRKSVETGEGVYVWTTTLAALDKHLTLLVNAGSEDSARVEAILHRSRIAMSEALEHFHAAKVRELKTQTSAFNAAAISMLSTLDNEALVEAAAAHIPRLGIDTFSIALFENMDPQAETMRPFLVLRDNERIDRTEPFRRSLIAAPEIVEDRPHALVVEPLCFYEEAFGVAALAYGPTEGSVYEQLGAFASAAVKGLLLSSQANATKSLLPEREVLLDPLTGAYTRSYLERRFVAEIARANELNHPLSLIVMDMDDFQQLNNNLGEAYGNEALKDIVDTVNRCAGPMVDIVRLNDNRFAVLSPNTDVQQAKAMAELIHRRLKLVLAFKYHGYIAASSGIETTHLPYEADEASLVRSAQHALSAAKSRGKDCVVHCRDLK